MKFLFHAIALCSALVFASLSSAFRPPIRDEGPPGLAPEVAPSNRDEGLPPGFHVDKLKYHDICTKGNRVALTYKVPRACFTTQLEIRGNLHLIDDKYHGERGLC